MNHDTSSFSFLGNFKLISILVTLISSSSSMNKSVPDTPPPYPGSICSFSPDDIRSVLWGDGISMTFWFALHWWIVMVNIFHVHNDYFHFFFCESSVQFICPCIDWFDFTTHFLYTDLTQKGKLWSFVTAVLNIRFRKQEKVKFK